MVINLPTIAPVFEENEKKQRHKYLFPNIMAKAMAKVDERTQYESSMMSMFLILIGLLMMGVYYIFFVDTTLLFKIMIGLNSFFAFIFISSQLTTTYQQYVTYMNAIESFGMEKPIKKKLNIFTRKK